MSRLRLLKVLVQPMFVVDDGDTLTEQVGKAVEVPGSAWAQWASTAFGPDDLAALQEQYDTATAEPIDPAP